jgi:hypothetical protein
MSEKKKDLICTAVAAGYNIEKDGYGIRIVKRDQRTGKVKIGLELHEDGTAFDMMVSLEVAKGIRSYDTMKTILGLTR